MVVGLTGSIGMGKSTVSSWFVEMGVPVSDADAVVHKLYAPGGAAVGPIKEAFGDSVLDRDGGIDRPLLSKLVVGAANADNMKRLEALVHPLVAAERDTFIGAAVRRGDELAVLDIPLLFETHQEDGCDAIVVVSAPADVQRKRVLARPNMTPEKFEGILGRQVPDAEKRARADHVLDTGTAPEKTRAALAAFVATCRDKVAAERLRQRFMLTVGVAAGATAVLFALSPSIRRRFTRA